MEVRVSPDLSRFRRSIRISPSDCWEWSGGTFNNTGYAQFHVPGLRGLRAHRWIYAQIKGPVEGVVIRHTCDNKLCVNPAHLIPGTQRDNIRDKVERGRQARGEQVGGVKLTADLVRDIRRRVSSGESQADVGRSVGVTRYTVYKIVHRKTWKHIL